MKYRLYARLEKFYANTMNNYNKLNSDDEAASTEMSDEKTLTVAELRRPSVSELVTSIHEIEEVNKKQTEKPSYRVLIKTISIHTMDEVYSF